MLKSTDCLPAVSKQEHAEGSEIDNRHAPAPKAVASITTENDNNMEKNVLELSLSVGDSLQLQFHPGKATDERYYVRVIGYLTGRSIITTTPTSNGKLMFVKEGQQFAVRLLSGNSVQGFVSTVMKNAATPYPYIHLSYPKELESKVVRKAQRVNTKIIAAVQNHETGKSHIKTKSALISDLSTAGALVISPEAIGEVGDMISISTKMQIADVAEYVNISAIIRRYLDNVEDDDGKVKFKYGVEFQLLEERDRLVIHGYVYEQIARSLDK